MKWRARVRLRPRPKSDTGQVTAISRERNNKRSRIKQRLHLIFISESIPMQIARIYVQEDARHHFFDFLTTEDIAVHDEQNTNGLTSSRFTQAC
jgi:hypothetical protein